MPLPQQGRDTESVLDDLAALRAHDARWQEGRTFGLVHDSGPEVHRVAAAAAAEMFLHENALNTIAVPSLAQIQRDVVGAVAELLHRPDAAGFMRSGGTESILMAVKAARERARSERGIERGHMVVAESAHAAFHKGAHYFGLDLTSVPVDHRWRADVDATADAVRDSTVMVVGSTPQYPQGVIDPIRDPAAVADDVGASFHTDDCMGGFVLPFMERPGGPDRAVGLQGPRGHIDQRRGAQARLLTERGLDHPSPRQGATPPPDLRLRRLVGWLLRITEHAGQQTRGAHGGRVGGHAA